MASSFRARPTAEPGSGGKMLRGRRVMPSASPYSRPENSQAPPTPESENPRWFSRLISGAGKLLSSVFPVHGSDSSCSSDSDGAICDSSDEEDADGSFKDFEELNQTGKKLESTKNFREEQQPRHAKSETKSAIEQWLLQETFTREECNRLTKIIQSRVRDYPASENGDAGISKKLPDKTVGSGIAFRGAWLNPDRKYSEMTPYALRSLNDFSPGSSVLGAYMPDLRKTAITEAKKWFEEKKVASSSKSDLEHGPCTLNTDMLQYGSEGDVGSPVDMAKSYMQALPPWQSPIPRVDLYKEESPYTTANHSLLLSTATKRSYEIIGSMGTLDVTRRIRLKSTEKTPKMPVFKQVDSSSRMSEHEANQPSSATNKTVLDLCGASHDSISLPAIELVDTPAQGPAKIIVKDGCPDGVPCALQEKASEVILPENNGACDAICNHTSLNTISEPEETVIAVGSSHAALPSEAARGDQSFVRDPSSLVTDENQDREQASLINEQLGNISVTHKSHIQDILQVEQNGAVDVVEELLISEPKAVSLEGISDADEVADRIDVQASDLQIRSGTGRAIEDNNYSQLDLLSDHKGADPIIDSRLQDVYDEEILIQEPNCSIIRDSGNEVSSIPSCSSSGLRTEHSLISSNKESDNPTKSSNGELAANNPHDLSSAGIPSVLGTNSVVDKNQNGTTMKSIKEALVESRLSTGPGRRRGRNHVKRAVAKPRRGRGRGT